MAEREGLNLRLVGVLVVIMLGSGLFLTVIYGMTIPHIQEHEARARERAVFEVLPGAVEYSSITEEEQAVYLGVDDDGEPVGYAVEAQGAGFQDMITLMVGLDRDMDKVTGIAILKMAETPGLGARISEEEFRNQFAGKDTGDPFVAGKDFEAISGATLSSQTVGDIVRKAADMIAEIEPKGGESR